MAGCSHQDDSFAESARRLRNAAVKRCPSPPFIGALAAKSLIAKDTTAQEVVALLADRADALELELEIDRVVGIALRIVDPVPRDQAEGHAAAVVLEAEEAFERARLGAVRIGRQRERIVQRVVPA